MVEADAPKNASFPRCLVDIIEEKGKIVLFNDKFASWEEALDRSMPVFLNTMRTCSPLVDWVL